MLLDIFNDDAFSLVEMTEAIETLPYVPGVLSELFTDKPIRTTAVFLDEKDGVVSLIPATVRGAPGTQNTRRSRRSRALAVPHLSTHDAILADDVQGVRAFGSESELETVASQVNEVLSDMKQNLEATMAFHRAGAIAGKVLDADGLTELYNMFDLFGLVETSLTVNFTTPTVIKTLTRTIKQSLRTALGATPWTGIRVLCGSDFFTNLINLDEVKTAYERFQENSFARQDQGQYGTGGFEFGGVRWEEFDYDVDSVEFLDPMTARVVPVGIPGLFRRYLAPADYMETVNTPGKTMYAKQWLMPNDKGVELEAQVNPVYLCTRPKCLIELAGTV